MFHTENNMRCASVLFRYLSWSCSLLMTSAILYDVDSQCPNIDVITCDEDKKILQDIKKDFTSTKYKWKEITEVMRKGLSHNKRNIGVTFSYRKFKLKKLKEWDSVESYLKHSNLGCDFFTKQHNNITIKFVNSTTSCDNSAVVKNTFPYHMDDDISAVIVWSQQTLGISRIKELIEYRFPSDKHDIAIFETPDQHKTISLSHVHFLVRPRKTGDYFVYIDDKK